MKIIFNLAIAIVLLTGAPALAQETTPADFDSRWGPYLGCWTIALGTADYPVAVPAGTTVCVKPTGRNEVTITTTVDGKQVLEQTVVADGSAQQMTQADCRGTQISEWSRDGERLFTRVELQCADRPARAVSGISLLANGQWIEAQATLVDGNHDVRVRRYRRAAEPSRGIVPVASPLSIEDIIEASKKVQSHALEAALDEAGGRYTLNSRVLTQLADGGVSPNVIDLMVAQSYPDRFRVERDTYQPSMTADTGYTSGGGSTSVFSGSSTSVFIGSAGYPYPYYDPFYYSYYYYSPFAYPYYWGAGYGYRYGYPYRNYYNYYYPGGPYYVNPVPGSVVSGDPIAPPGSPDSRGGSGIVVNGRGYTRVRPSSGSGEGGSVAPRSRSGGGTRSVGSGSDSSSSSSSSGSSGSSSSGGGSVSSGGYSGGGNSGGGGRTAQPR
jgi:hypothetical protein